MSERTSARAAVIGAAIRLNEAAGRDRKRVAIGVCDIAVSEFSANVGAVVEQTRVALARTRRSLVHADEVAIELGLAPVAAHAGAWDDAIVQASEDLANQLISSAELVPTTSDDRDGAFARTVGRRPPARLGASATHDCVIAESALRVARLRPPETTILLSSNTKDFGAGANRLDPALAAEFKDAGLLFATNWVEVAGKLGI